jgi:hypothetical protein
MPIKPPAHCSHSKQPVDKRISSTHAPAYYVADATDRVLPARDVSD